MTSVTATGRLMVQWFEMEAAMSGDYKELKAWQKAMQLVSDIYAVTRAFPRDELYGLTSQMRRAAVSIPSNIAEGKGRYSQKELIQFLLRARGSLLELETQILIAKQLTFLDAPAAKLLLGNVQELERILNGLLNRFREYVKQSEEAP